LPRHYDASCDDADDDDDDDDDDHDDHDDACRPSSSFFPPLLFAGNQLFSEVVFGGTSTFTIRGWLPCDVIIGLFKMPIKLVLDCDVTTEWNTGQMSTNCRNDIKAFWVKHPLPG